MNDTKQEDYGTSSGQDLSRRQGLIAVNDLTYVLEPDLSVASNKTHKKHFFQSNTYTAGQQGICILNSGADYIDTRRSWLQFDVDFGGAAASTAIRGMFGQHGSALNLIRDIRISTRSGDELCRIADLNLLSNMMLPLTYDKEWFDNQGRLMGYGGQILNNSRIETILNVFPAGQQDPRLVPQNRFAIPMYCLAPLFGYGRLMPAMLMSGLRIEINWETTERAVKQNVAVGGAKPDDNAANNQEYLNTHTITNPQFVLASVQLSDSIQRALNELSATNGLEIVYVDYEKTSYSQGNDFSAGVTCEVRKSCSRALKAFARVRVDPGGLGQETRDKDIFKAESGFPIYEYQWQLGSLYFPQQKVSNSANSCTMTANEAYCHTLEAIDKFHGSARQPYMTFQGDDETWEGAKAHAQLLVNADADNANWQQPAIANNHSLFHNGKAGSFANDGHVVPVSLERSTMFNLAGVPVNNSRVLALQCRAVSHSFDLIANGGGNLGSVNAFSRTLDTYLKYVKLARVFLNNVEVEQ